jgi:6-phosphogluconate dehydrogenase
MMIVGDAAVKCPDPIRHSCPGPRGHPRTLGREKVGGTAEQGYTHCGPSGAGHFVKMVHNGIEYGLMAAYAERQNLLKATNVGKTTGCRDDTAARNRTL